DDDDRAREPLGAENFLDEIVDLAAALADQADDDDVGARVPGDHAEQHALADAAAGEEPDALTAAHREERIDAAHADVERPPHRVTTERVQEPPHQRHPLPAAQRGQVVERLPERIDHASEQLLADGNELRVID